MSLVEVHLYLYWWARLSRLLEPWLLLTCSILILPAMIIRRPSHADADTAGRAKSDKT